VQRGEPLGLPHGKCLWLAGSSSARPVSHALRRLGFVAQLGRERWLALSQLSTFGCPVSRAPSVARLGCYGLSVREGGLFRLPAWLSGERDRACSQRGVGSTAWYSGHLP